MSGKVLDELAHLDQGADDPSGVLYYPQSPSLLAKSGNPGRALTELGADFCVLDNIPPASCLNNAHVWEPELCLRSFRPRQFSRKIL